MPLLLALLAALCFAAAYVLQYHEAHQAPARLFLSPRLLLELARHPVWLAGIAAMVVGGGLQAAALGTGSLAVVEPLLPTSVLFALPISAAWHRERLARGDWVGAVMVSGGLALLLGVGQPGVGHAQTDAESWTLIGLGSWGLALSLVAAGRRVATARATLLAAGAGVLFGYQDALTRGVLDLLTHGVWRVAVSWEPYALLVTGLAGLTLVQSAYEAGPLRACLPAQLVAEPVVGVLIGTVALGEGIERHGLAPLWESLGAVVMLVGTYLLSRSRLVSRDARVAVEPTEQR